MQRSVPFAEYVEDIEINTLRGRMLNLPGRTLRAGKLDILFIHGHHSSIERNEGLLTFLSTYGNVCAPDMPGFGGMDPLRKIGQKPTIDNLADYLAAFIRLRYGTKKKFVVIGVSFGFVVLTRMFQKYPDLQTRAVMNVSLVGFLSNTEFVFSKTRMALYQIGCWFLRLRVPSFIVREFLLRKWFLSTIYTRTRNAKVKFQGVSPVDKGKYVDFEVHLWRCNDVPTHYFTNLQFLRCNLLKDKHIESPLVHIAFSIDQYFDSDVVKEHMKIVYSDVRIVDVVTDGHGPTMMSDENVAAGIVPEEIRRILESLQ